MKSGELNVTYPKNSIVRKKIVPLQAMVKKSVSILMLFSALALMLGHNFIGHHHHDFEHDEVSHHHDDDHHDNHHHQHENDTESECDGRGHFFSDLQHGSEGLTFLKSRSVSDTHLKQIYHFTSLNTSIFIFEQILIENRQNAPPYVADFYNLQNFLSSGLRGPPAVIV